MPKEIDNKRYYSYDDIHSMVKRISGDIISRDISINVIVAIATGGWFPARILRTFLPHSGKFPLELYSIGLLNYDANDKILAEPLIMQKLPENIDVRDKSILLVDEVVDSGKTFAKALEYLRGLGPKKIYTAALHLKSKSSFKPDFVGENVSDEWIVYPWDITV